MSTSPGRKAKVLAAGFAATLLAASVALVAQAAAPTPAPPAPAPAANPVPQNGPTILDTYKGQFLIGNAADVPGNFTPEELELIKKNFDVLTPENCMKPGPMHPAEGTYNFTAADAFVKWCTDNNIAIHGHNLAWHSQSTNWMFQGVDKETGLKRFKDHITTVVSRYKGKIKSWDVVNEAINDGGTAETGKTENLRNSMYTQNIGPEFLTIAFKTAHEADPSAQLYYNDYNIEKGPKHESSMILLKRLIADGAPIYGVGIQGHWSTGNGGPPMADIDKAIADYGSLGLKVSISELDVTINGTAGGQFGNAPADGAPAGPPGAGAPPGAGRRGRGGRGAPGGPGGPGAPAPGATPAPAAPGASIMTDSDFRYVAAPATPPAPAADGAAPAGAPPAPGARGGRGGRGAGGFGGGGFGGGAGGGRGGAAATPEQLKIQADDYAKLFEIFEKHKDVVARVTFWGLNDRRSWRSGQSPLIFDNNNQRKPAYNAIVDVILHPGQAPKP